jgi:acetylglutamate synthase
MTDLRLKALGTVADTLGVERIFNIMSEDEQKELFWMSADCFVNSNVYDQQKQMQLLSNQARMREFFGGNAIIKEVYDFGYKKIIRKE